MYVDIEQALIAWLSAQVEARYCTTLPADIIEELPVVRVERVGGTEGSIALDVAMVDIDCFAATRALVSDLARAVRQAVLFDLPGVAVEGAVFVAASTLSAPYWRPYENTQLRRFGAVYEITARATARL